MVSAPYLVQLHPHFLGAVAVPVPRGPSLCLRAADGGFTRSHRHLLSLPKAPRFARVRSQPRPPEERSHAGTRFAEDMEVPEGIFWTNLRFLAHGLCDRKENGNAKNLSSAVPVLAAAGSTGGGKTLRAPQFWDATERRRVQHDRSQAGDQRHPAHHR